MFLRGLSFGHVRQLDTIAAGVLNNPRVAHLLVRHERRYEVEPGGLHQG
jgi:hypothetical protein